MLYITGLTWEDETIDHIARHGVTLEEVFQATGNQLGATRSRGYMLLYGQTDGGRYLTIVLDDEGGGDWFVVTARDSDNSERRRLRR